MSKVKNEKVNRTNPGKADAYRGAKLGTSKGSDNADINQFQGEDVRVTPDTETGTGTRHSNAGRATGATPLRVRVQAGYGALNHGGTHTKNATKE
jgi:hypothetical protein